MKINKKKLFLAVLMASGLFTSQQALANDTSQKNIEAKLNSVQWKGLKPSRTGGDNIAFAGFGAGLTWASLVLKWY